MIDIVLTTPQVTFVQPPPAGAVSQIVPNQLRQNAVTVNSSEIDNPGANQSAVADSLPRVADVYTVNSKLSQVFPVNAPPVP